MIFYALNIQTHWKQLKIAYLAIDAKDKPFLI